MYDRIGRYKHTAAGVRYVGRLGSWRAIKIPGGALGERERWQAAHKVPCNPWAIAQLSTELLKVGTVSR